ncbi:hypothetical protein THMIRHAM_19250 [Thiomicrorhabdus immobilis]|uniref:Uncharacterized protein n=1 Tax=Thiomicrorhabdus immobilis TaxID=2791037 RepID=A0ABM7MFD4_9GAMM|nr:hypothetical protein THMIRHAM_19250 [Thiomicrorhabdus immobilis]
MASDASQWVVFRAICLRLFAIIFGYGLSVRLVYNLNLENCNKKTKSNFNLSQIDDSRETRAQSKERNHDTKNR